MYKDTFFENIVNTNSYKQTYFPTLFNAPLILGNGCFNNKNFLHEARVSKRIVPKL